MDAIATAGLFGGEAFSTAGASFSQPEYPSSRQEYRSQQRITASGYPSESGSSAGKGVKLWPIVQESLQGPALSAMLLGIAVSIFARPESVYESFYDPLFRSLLAVLMLVMGMEAWSRLGELCKVAQWYVV